MYLSVQFVRFVEECQPPVVAPEFVDAYGPCHTFVDKTILFTADWLGEDSKHPQRGLIRCEVN